MRSGTGQSGLRHRCGGCVSHLCSKPLDILDRAIRVLNFLREKFCRQFRLTDNLQLCDARQSRAVKSRWECVRCQNVAFSRMEIYYESQ